MTKTLDELKAEVTRTEAAHISAIQAWHNGEVEQAIAELKNRGINIGDKVTVKTSRNAVGILTAVKIEHDSARPFVNKIKKDGTASSFSYYVYRCADIGIVDGASK